LLNNKAIRALPRVDRAGIAAGAVEGASLTTIVYRITSKSG
jgi:hypothetical protein